MGDRLAVPRDENVPLMDARLRPRSMWVDAHDHRARSVAAIDCDRLKAKTEIAAGDATLALEFWRHTFDRGRWYNKHAPAWPKYRHADRLTESLPVPQPVESLI